MARRPPDDPRVADLNRYRKARQRAAKAPPPRRPGGQSFLGGRPRAGWILVAVVLALLLLTFGPRLF